MLKKYTYLFLITIFLLLNSGLAFAQTEDMEITSLETQIMPEYDTTDILMVNSIRMTNKSTQDFTGELKWRVPKGSIKHIVTENTNGNNHLQFNIVPSQAFDEMVWKLPNPLKPGEIKDIHLEFYYNNLQGNPDKQFIYDLIPAYPVISAKILLLQPTKASIVKITPDFGQPMSNKGWTYYMKSLNNVAKDQVTKITVAYTKSDPSPSVVPGQQQTGQNQNNQSAAATNSSNDKVLIFAAAAIAIVIVLAVTYTKVQRNNREDEDYEDEDYENEDYEEDEDEDDDYEDDEDDEDDDYEDDELEDEDTDDIDFKLSKSQKNRVERINKSTITNEKKKDTSKLRRLESKKKELKRKLEEGLITDVDYYEAVMELEDEAKE